MCGRARLEFAGQNPRAAAALYGELAERSADRNARAELLARQARCLRKAGVYDDAVRIFTRIVREHPDGLTPSGMPLGLLARLQIVECRRLSGDLDGARPHALDAYRELLKKRGLYYSLYNLQFPEMNIIM